MNAAGHWFWWALTGLCLLWYSTITLYVAFKGALDIKAMLRRLEATEGGGGAGRTQDEIEKPADQMTSGAKP